MKSRRFSLAIACVLCLSLVFVFVRTSLMKTSTPALAQTDAAAPAPTPNAAFTGKVVVVSFIDGSGRYTTCMEEVQVHKLSDRYFLMGKVVDEGDPANWAKSHLVFVPINNVTRICLLDSVEETRAAYREAHKGVPVTPPPHQPEKAVLGQQKNSPPAEVLMKPFFFGQTDK